MSIEQTAKKKNTEDILNELESLVIRIVPKEKILKKIVTLPFVMWTNRVRGFFFALSFVGFLSRFFFGVAI